VDLAAVDMTFMGGGAVWHAMILDEVAGTSRIAAGSEADRVVRGTEAGRVDKARKADRATMEACRAAGTAAT
jgi:hypothetical protein